MTHFNPDMLSIARNFRGLSQTELIAEWDSLLLRLHYLKLKVGT
jgi:hypothetical protein